MTNRQQHIEAGALAEYGSECRALHHFTKGAEWADAHPADETITASCGSTSDGTPPRAKRA